MIYLSLFKNRSEYESEKYNLADPNVSWDTESVHYSSELKPQPSVVATLLFTDFQDYNLVDMYDFEDVNVPYSTASISIENDVPVYLLFNDGDEFKFLVSVDGDTKYRFNNEKPGTIISEINDELIEMLQEMGPSDKFMQLVTKNKGKWIIDSKDAKIENGIIYNDKTYWATGNESGSETLYLYEYQSEDEESLLWFPIGRYDEHEEGEKLTVDIYYNDEQGNIKIKETSTVTMTNRYALAMIM